MRTLPVFAGFAALVTAGGALALPSPAILEYRYHMFETPVMTLANRTIELMFDTARIEPGEPAPLPRVDTAPDFSYAFDG